MHNLSSGATKRAEKPPELSSHHFSKKNHNASESLETGGSMNLPQHMTCKQAAEFLCCAEYTLRLSRTTGLLFNKRAPEYRKLGRKVIYDTRTLINWVKQFELIRNTACNSVEGNK